ncbi:putative defense protein 2 [Penaeus japonicus]|uniref:putative defense protein 2 n=1 Tax=Penaeus japonicus TaxID=27405 RepID=UPI001C70BD69|nr:putative defense protein 2 [Penaeus japonicus]
MARRSFCSSVAMTLLWLVCIVTGFPKGAPYTMCGYYLPSHNTPTPRANAGAPYQLLVSADYFDFREAGHDFVVVNVTSKTGSPPFKGFVVSAYDGSGKPYGKWDSNPYAHQVPRCKKPAMTHNDASLKREATLVWRPPEGEHREWGWVQFRATVVKDMNNFWAELPHTLAEEGG